MRDGTGRLRRSRISMIEGAPVYPGRGSLDIRPDLIALTGSRRILRSGGSSGTLLGSRPETRGNRVGPRVFRPDRARWVGLRADLGFRR